MNITTTSADPPLHIHLLVTFAGQRANPNYQSQRDLEFPAPYKSPVSSEPILTSRLKWLGVVHWIASSILLGISGRSDSDIQTDGLSLAGNSCALSSDLCCIVSDTKEGLPEGGPSFNFPCTDDTKGSLDYLSASLREVQDLLWRLNPRKRRTC